jgi:hypothetical protein
MRALGVVEGPTGFVGSAKAGSSSATTTRVRTTTDAPAATGSSSAATSAPISACVWATAT